jgi:hypothetical protein
MHVAQKCQRFWVNDMKNKDLKRVPRALEPSGIREILDSPANACDKPAL